MDNSPPPRVVVLGTGVAAIEATLLLHARLGGRVDLQVVSDSNRFLFRPNLVYVPFGAEPEASALDIDMVLANQGIPLLVQPVEGVDSDAGCVHVGDGSKLPYEHLVIATGARAVPQEIPGVREHAVTASDSATALALRDRFAHLRGRAREGTSGRVLFVVPRHNQCSLPLYEVALMLDTWLRREHARAPVRIDMLDRAAFAQVPLEVTGDPGRPVRLRAGADADYRVGVSRAWRTSRRVFASSVLTRFAAGEPLRAGAGSRLMDVGARAMAGMLAD